METHDLTDQELVELRESLPSAPLEGGARASIIDWDAVREELTQRGYFKITDIVTELEEDLKSKGIQRKVYYSQVLDMLKRMAKKPEYNVVKKRIVDGEHKGTYYKVERV